MLSYDDLMNIMKSIKSIVLIKEYILIGRGDMNFHITNNNCWETDYVSYTVFYKNEIISQGDSVGSYTDMILYAVSKRAPDAIGEQILNFFGV